VGRAENFGGKKGEGIRAERSGRRARSENGEKITKGSANERLEEVKGLQPDAVGGEWKPAKKKKKGTQFRPF